MYGVTGVCSSAYDTQRQIKVAIKKLARPFQSPVHAKRAYREIRMLKHMHHENVSHMFLLQLLLLPTMSSRKVIKSAMSNVHLSVSTLTFDRPDFNILHCAWVMTVDHWELKINVKA